MVVLLTALTVAAALTGAMPSVTSKVALRLCVSAQPMTAHGIGVFHQRVLDATANLPLQVESYSAPRMRCLVETQRGVADALIGVFSPDRQEWLVFPMRNSLPNTDQSVGAIQIRIYRRIGSLVDWDGQVFSGLEGQPLGVKYGSSYGVGLTRKGIALDDRSTSTEQLVAKLIHGRVAAILLTDEALAALDAIAPGQIEALPRAYNTMPLYLAFTKDFARRNPFVVQQIWSRFHFR